MQTTMKPTWKPNLASTYHRDGTVSYWSVLRQSWVRRPAAEISDRDLATMTEQERRRILAARAKVITA